MDSSSLLLRCVPDTRRSLNVWRVVRASTGLPTDQLSDRNRNQVLPTSSVRTCVLLISALAAQMALTPNQAAAWSNSGQVPLGVGIKHQHSPSQALFQPPAQHFSFSVLCVLSSAPTRTGIISVCAGPTPSAILRCLAVMRRPRG